MNLQTYKEKTKLLKKMAEHYYVLDNPIASDEEYDRLYHELVAYEKEHKEHIDFTSPTQRIGDKIIENFEKIEHIEKMWSLEDVFNINELESWINKISKSNINISFMCDAKFDGASLNLIYDKGILISAATRGDGSIGENVLENAKMIHSIPLSIPYLDKIEIRGEVIINKNDFEEINNERIKNNESIFANPRNAASGSLRQLDPKITKQRKLRFIPWGFGYMNSNENSFFDRLNMIKNLGFIDTKLSTKCKNLAEIEAFYHKLIAIRHTYNIMLDGMVVRIDNIDSQNLLGYTAKNPRFAVAYKFPPIEKQTKILDVSFSVGRSGVITPVAELEPINIEGASVSRATLHNFDEIEKKDIRINDNVFIIRSGDVIPKIIKPIKELRNGSEIKIKKPSFCPICNSELLVENILIKCQNLQCKARVKNSIIHFCSKKAMNMVGLGDKIVDFLFEEGIIKNILDIYKIKKEMLENKAGFKDKKIQNILDSIQQSKNIELWRFINALGIEHIGESASKRFAKLFGFRIFHISYDELIAIDGIGSESATSLITFMDTNRDFVNELLEIIQPTLEENNVDSGILNGEVIVITGTLSINRDDMKKRLENLGANISASISKKTTILLAGENGGSKLEKARSLGIKILNEDEMNDLINKH